MNDDAAFRRHRRRLAMLCGDAITGCGERCECCGSWRSATCWICRGYPDGTSLEELARGIAQVDRATARGREVRDAAA